MRQQVAELKASATEREHAEEAASRRHRDQIEGMVEECSREVVHSNEQLGQEISGGEQAESKGDATLEALRESERKFRSVAEQSQDGISVTDEQGLIVAWNRRLEGMTGLTAKEVLGQTIWDAQFQMMPEEQRTPETHERLRTALQEFLRTGTAPWMGQLLERELIRPNGNRLFVPGVTFPIQTDRGFMRAASPAISPSTKRLNLL